MRVFAQQCPKVRVLVNDCAPDQFISRILDEQVDFGIGTPERPGAAADAGVMLDVVTRSRFFQRHCG